MPAGTHHVFLEQGTTLDATFTWRQAPTPEALAADPDAVGDPIDLTGYSARMQVRQSLNSPTVIHEFSTANGSIELGGSEGTVRILADADTTAGWSWGSASASKMSAVYDLELEDADGKTRRLLEGKFTVKREVTRDA
jgi:hypothetical protein